MKVCRGPRTSKQWRETDAQSLKAWVNSWRPGTIVKVDGTIDKSGTRHTDLGIEIEPHDVVALNKALELHQAEMLAYFKKENAELRATVSKLESALRKIHSLTSYRRTYAPSPDALADATSKIANHFAWSFSRKRPLKLNMRWVKWKSL